MSGIVLLLGLERVAPRLGFTIRERPYQSVDFLILISRAIAKPWNVGAPYEAYNDMRQLSSLHCLAGVVLLLGLERNVQILEFTLKECIA